MIARRSMTRVGPLAMLLAVTACIHVQAPVPLAASFYDEKEPVVILMAKLPQPAMYREGQQGLLDMAVNSAMTSGLGDHVSSLDMSEFGETRATLAAALASRGISPIVIDEPLDTSSLAPHEGEKKDFAPYDFRTIADKYGAKRALFIEVQRVGLRRNYYGFIPLDDPSAVFTATAMLVDLESNGLLWYEKIDEMRPSPKEWDSPPDYPDLTNTIYQAMESARMRIVGPFSR